MGARRDLVEANRTAINQAVRRHRGRSVSLFGSTARGSDTSGSDVDFLVEFERDSSLLDLLRLQDDLEELLGCSVDVISTRGLKRRDQHIRAEAVPL